MTDAIARDGLFFGYFSDGGAMGEKDMKEVFVEVEAPLLAGKQLAKELTLNVSSRLTDDEIYGSNTTESVKIGWRPVNSLLIRGTYGTAYRSPNLRELFLMNQTGFGTIFDLIKDNIGPERIKFKSPVKKIFHDGHLITQVIYNNKKEDVETLISTFPLSSLIKALEPSPPIEIKELVDNLKYRNLRKSSCSRAKLNILLVFDQINNILSFI